MVYEFFLGRLPHLCTKWNCVEQQSHPLICILPMAKTIELNNWNRDRHSKSSNECTTWPLTETWQSYNRAFPLKLGKQNVEQIHWRYNPRKLNMNIETVKFPTKYLHSCDWSLLSTEEISLFLCCMGNQATEKDCSNLCLPNSAKLSFWISLFSLIRPSQNA